ncbi:IS1595 family transposase [Pseudoduganella umbonata]|uniref:IS1595 family transposase n=1 Tax=Pseudoduganella umbonata TaxID=864828 RepID=A0A4P8HM37_9BURK|nr:IS1595 family transposase [Pseudoduganella umbonata]MBB3219266.1 transposase-like protein [Pseudoduganella umbonata]QCP09378.1 IS1595 family transposase [Pseudoduganella umbonata]
MGTADVSVVLKVLEQVQLSDDEIALVQGLLANLVQPGQSLRLIEEAAGKRSCPECGGNRCHRSGQANGLQRYRCVACRRSFNALTGTPLARLRLRDKWLPYLQCLIDSITVRKAAARVAVAKSTSFRWRHRFIAAVRRAPDPRLSGIVEADETYHLESQKGSRNLDRPPRKRGGKARRRGVSAELDCILVARDRNRQTCDFVTGRGPVTASQLARHLLPVLAKDVLLVTDGANAYKTFARQAGVTHEAVNVRAGIRARGAIHIQGVNGWHSRFKTWLRRFNGVASRYLANYTGWQRVLDAAALRAPGDWLRVAVV